MHCLYSPSTLQLIEVFTSTPLCYFFSPSTVFMAAVIFVVLYLDICLGNSVHLIQVTRLTNVTVYVNTVSRPKYDSEELFHLHHMAWKIKIILLTCNFSLFINFSIHQLTFPTQRPPIASNHHLDICNRSWLCRLGAEE